MKEGRKSRKEWKEEERKGKKKMRSLEGRRRNREKHKRIYYIIC